MRRVSGIRFSKCSDFSYGILTQSLEPTKTATGSFCWTHWRIRHPWLRSRSRQRRVAELLVMNRTLRKSNTLHKSHFFTYPCAISLIYVSLPTCASCGECVILSISINKEDFIGTICVVGFNSPSIAALGWCYVRVVHWYVCRFVFLFTCIFVCWCISAFIYLWI